MGEKVRERVGVLTFHRCINYGSYWQARCLVEGLVACGYDAVLLDHRSPAVDAAEWRVALRPTLPTPVSKADVELYACKTRRCLHAIEQLPLSKPFDIDHPEEMEPVDTVVIGSDEVWNIRHPWFGCRPAFFGMWLKARRVISYAASFGNYSCWEGLSRPWPDMIRRLDAISVRDDNSWWILNNEVGIQPETVLDPSLQFPLPPDGAWRGPQGRFVLVYGHNFSPGFAKRAQRWARSQGLRLVSIGYRNDWADNQWIEADPHDFAHAMTRAEAVVTNFFHGCVFSLLNKRPFVTELSQYRTIKVQSLMDLLGSHERIVSGETPQDVYERLLSRPARPEVYTRIEEMRAISDAFLDRALMGPHAAQIA